MDFCYVGATHLAYLQPERVPAGQVAGAQGRMTATCFTESIGPGLDIYFTKTRVVLLYSQGVFSPC